MTSSDNEMQDNFPAQEPMGALVAIEQSRAVQEVQAALIIAKKFPRDTTAAYNNLIEACKRASLARSATYSYKRGNAVISDASIRLAEVMAQTYGNLDFGVRELERRTGLSICESYCWDMQTNVKQKKVFEVPHEMKANGVIKKLNDPRDIYELVANQGARRLRACILGIIPADFKEGALNQVKLTISNPKDRPVGDIIREMVVAFKTSFQVTQEMIEEKLGHPVGEMTRDELFDFQGIFNALKDGQSKRSDWFGTAEKEEQKSSGLNEKLKEQQRQAEEKKAAIAQTSESKVEPKPVVKEPEVTKQKERGTMETMAGQMKITCLPQYKDMRIRDIPEIELLEVLSAADQRTDLSDDFMLFYSNACVWLGRKTALKSI